MKHSLFAWGANPQPFRGPENDRIVLPVTTEELKRIGVAPHKIRRVESELRRLIDADPALGERRTVLRLARQISEQFL